MRKLSFVLLTLLLNSTLHAASYYLANNGNDANSGTSMSSPWQSLGKLNATVLQAGDSVFFRCGDVFRGEIQVSQSGTQSNPIVFTSYGTGNKPIISGAVLNSSWVASGANFVTTITDSVANFFVNGHTATLARYPNENQYLTLDSAQTNYLRDQSITGLSASLLEGNICVHTTQWSWEKSPIASVSGDQINFQTPLMQKGEANFGYFLYNDMDHLDTIAEWFYDKATSSLYYHPENGIDPNNLITESSIYKNGIYLTNNVAYITITNLAFEKQSEAGVTMSGTGNHHIEIESCNFSGQYNYGVSMKARYGEVSNSYFREIDGIALLITGSSFKPTIHHNTFRNNGRVRNYGIGTEINSTSIMATFIDSCYIHHNDIDSAGYCGISVDGAYGLIERNVVKHAMRLNNDGGGIKSYGAQSHHNIIRNNFVSESDGNKEGTYNANFVTPAIYFDFNVNNCRIEQNTVFNHTQKGIFQNSGDNNNTIRENIIYQSDYGLDLNGNPLMPTAITGMHITKNVFFARNDQSYLLRQVDYTGMFNTGVIDSNYYIQPYNSAHYMLRVNGTTPTSYSFADWQLTGFDEHSVPSFYNWSVGTNLSELFMNPSDDTLNVDLAGDLYLDLDSNDVCGSFKLAPYTSRVLFTTGQTCTSSITENASETIRIYPNPTSGKMYVKFNSADAELTLLDVSGQVLLTATAVEAGNGIDLSELPGGIYFLRIEDGKTIYTGKIIKQ